MDAQQFLAEFGHIANAPDGVARLRELVLQLAISGRLVPPDGNETPIRESIERAGEQRRQYEQDNGLRPTHNRKLASAIPYSIPQHWQWEALENLALYIQRGKSPKYAESGKVRVVSQKCVQWAAFDVTPARYIADDSLHAYGDERFLRGGDLLWNSTGTGTVGRVAICETQQETYCVADSHVTVVRLSDTVLPRYLWCVIASPWIQMRFQPTHPDSLVSGTTQQVEFSTSSARSLPIPVPPLDEQTRIVAKIDELMSLCDKLEDEQQKRRKLQNTLRQTTLQAVAKAQSPHELQTSWARLEANFGRLFSAPEDVDEAIAELKNLAVRGLLAEGIAQDLDIEKIKSDCQALRNEYTASGLMRKQKLVAMAETETSYPPHWVTVAFDEVAIVIGGVTKGRDLRGRETLICQYLSVANVQRGYFKLDELKTIQIAKDELEKYKVAKGDLLITEGGDWDKVGRTAIWPGGIDDCLHQNHVFKARVPSDLLLNEWVELVFNSGIGRDYFAGASKQTTNLASINMTQLRSFPLPIPPTTEQRAILSRLSELTQLCVEWRKLLVRRQEMSSLLAQATVASLTGIDLVTEEEVVKVPQTELISRLRLGQAPSIKDQAPLASILARHKGELATQDLWQRSTLEIDAFYAQLKTEVAHGWIEEPVLFKLRDDLDLEKIPESDAVLSRLLKSNNEGMYQRDLLKIYGENERQFRDQLNKEISFGFIRIVSASNVQLVDA